MDVKNMKLTILSSVMALIMVGCATAPQIGYADLKNAEELIVPQGDGQEKHYEGKELSDYLSTFQEKPFGLTLVVHTYKGEIKVNGYWYPITYSVKKQYNQSAIITILCEPKPFAIEQN